jgi:hypothetical protein
MLTCDAVRMSDDSNRHSLEETLRMIAQEVTRSVDRISELDVDEIVRSAGLDPDRARGWLDDAGQWLRTQAENVDFDVTFGAPDASDATTDFESQAPFSASTPSGVGSASDDALRGAGPHPLDVPTAEQGRAIAALESGRWILEPGTSALSSHGDGPSPHDALGVVRELRVRDWIDLDGDVTLVGHRALARWLEAGDRD